MRVKPPIATRQYLLAAALGLLHLALLAGVLTPLGRMLLMAHLGAFLLWQPIVAGQHRLGPSAVVLLIAAIAAFQFWLSWISLSVWLGILAALVAGQALPRGGLRARLPDLAGFAYAALVIVAWLAPSGLPGYRTEGALLTQIAMWSVVGLLPMLLPREYMELDSAAEPDPVVATIVMLALGAIVLAAFSFMFLARVDYPTALLRAVASVACGLGLLGWIWNPRQGFAGVALMMSRRMLAGGFSLEDWLPRVATIARSAESSAHFLDDAAESLMEMPGISGLAWSSDRLSLDGSLGRIKGATARFEHAGLVVTIACERPAGATALWRWDLMVLILAEFLRAREQAEELTEMGYVRAIHETGARLAHDVKNQLQSLEALLWAVDQGFERDPVGARKLLRRQLPALAGRIRQSLERLRHPSEAPVEIISAAEWWRRLGARHEAAGLTFVGFEGDGLARVPAAFLDRFADNAILNAIEKRAVEPVIEVRVRAMCRNGCCRVEVEDSGSAIATKMARRLFQGPVESNSGLGVGLYQVAREAATQGWVLNLASNRDGAVCLMLSGTCNVTPASAA